MQTEGFQLSPVQIDDLPGLADICHGELLPILRREIEKAITDACDLRSRWDGKRTVSFTLECLPDFERESCVWSLSQDGIVTKLAGSRRPRTSRVHFKRGANLLTAGVVGALEPEPEPMDDSSPIELGVAVDELLGGDLDLNFKRASIKVYLDIDDSQKKATEKRSVSFTIAVGADEDRLSVRLDLKAPQIKLAKIERKSAQRLYVNRRGRTLVAELEPDAAVPAGRVGPGPIGDHTIGQQSNVTPITRNAV